MEPEGNSFKDDNNLSTFSPLLGMQLNWFTVDFN
jgi:hypothetical protein